MTVLWRKRNMTQWKTFRTLIVLPLVSLALVLFVGACGGKDSTPSGADGGEKKKRGKGG